MITKPTEPDQTNDLTLRVARMLRHEVGDLLQGVYSTTAILLSRLSPELALERQMIVDLKQRAEQIKSELDATMLLVAAAPTKVVLIDLNNQVQGAIINLRRRHPLLPVSFETVGSCPIRADVVLLSEGLTLLWGAMAQGARHFAVTLKCSSEVELELRRDGHHAGPDQFAWIDRPFATTQQASLGLALALCARAMRAGGGDLIASSVENGLLVRFSSPIVVND